MFVLSASNEARTAASFHDSAVHTVHLSLLTGVRIRSAALRMNHAGTCITSATILTEETELAEEAALALAIATMDAIVMIGDSQVVIRNYASGRISREAACTLEIHEGNFATRTIVFLYGQPPTQILHSRATRMPTPQLVVLHSELWRLPVAPMFRRHTEQCGSECGGIA